MKEKWKICLHTAHKLQARVSLQASAAAARQIVGLGEQGPSHSADETGQPRAGIDLLLLPAMDYKKYYLMTSSI